LLEYKTTNGLTGYLLRKSFLTDKMKISKSLWQAVGLGILAGMRTSSAPLVINIILKGDRSKTLHHSPLAFMQSTKATIPFGVFALIELVGDKLPTTPNRTSAGGLIGRCLSGALAGATIYKANSKNAVVGGLLGTSMAFISTYACYFVRKGIAKKTDIPDPIIGAIEDALVIGTGTYMVKTS
jgi:uncharacterized membrane protein